MAQYVPSGKITGSTVPFMLGLGILAALVMGTILHLVGRAFYLILVFPVVWGFLLGVIMAKAVRLGKCRNTMVVVIVGLAVSAVSYVNYHGCDNAYIRGQVKEGIVQETKCSPEEADKAYEKYLVEEHGGTGFWAELSLRASFGMNIGRPGRSGSDKPLITGTGMYVYWIIELLVIAGLCVMAPFKAAREAFCEPCLEWYERKEVGRIGDTSARIAQKALAAKDYPAFASCLGEVTGNVVFALEKCPKCAASPVKVLLEAVLRDEKGKETRQTLYDDMFAREQANALLSAAAAPKAPPETPAGS